MMKRWMTVLLAAVLMLSMAVCPVGAEESGETVVPLWDCHEQLGVTVNSDTDDVVTEDGELGRDGRCEWVLIDNDTQDLRWDVAKLTRSLVLGRDKMPRAKDFVALEFDIYTSDATFGDMRFVFEVSSSGECDKLEREGGGSMNHMLGTTLKAGQWQTVRLNVADLNANNSGFVPENFNFFRIWNQPESPVFKNGLVVAIRDIKAVLSGKEATNTNMVNEKGARVITMNGDALGNRIVNIPAGQDPSNMAHRFLNFAQGDAIKKDQHAVELKLPTAYNITGRDTLCFDLYIEGYEYVKDLQLCWELTSSNAYDNQEIDVRNVTLAKLAGRELSDGWHEIRVPLTMFANKTEGTRVPGPFDPTSLNFMRTYVCGGIGDGVAKGKIVVAMDNLWFDGEHLGAAGAVETITMESGVTGNGLFNIPTEQNAANMANRFLNFKKGDAVKTASHAVSFVLDQPMNITGMDTMCFDLYLQGYEYAKDLKFEIELTSAGQCDNQEIKMVNVTLGGISNVALRDGWNHVEMPLSYFAGTTEGTAVPGAFDPARWNFMRTYICDGVGDGVAQGDIVAAIDNVYFTTDGGTGGNTDDGGSSGNVNENGELVLDSCDMTDGWQGNIKLNTGDAQEGKGCIELVINSGSFTLVKTFAPVNATGATALCFDLFVSSAEDMYSGSACHLEMTSSGMCDVEETAWNFLHVELEDGWNQVVLPLSDGTQGCDLSRVNYLRFYGLNMMPEQALTIRLDNIRLTTAEIEEPALDLGDYIIGRKDAAVATPVDKTVEVGKPYDPWASEGETEQNQDEPSAQEQPAAQETPWFAIVLTATGGVVLLVGVAVWLVKKNKKLGGVLAVLGAVVALVGVVLLCVAAADKTTPELPDAGGEQPGESRSSILTIDQTGHPENSAATVDVEALLKQPKDYDYYEEYKIRFQESTDLDHIDDLPRVMLHEGTTEQLGLSIAPADGATPEFFFMKEKDCWMMETWNGSNKFYLTADGATAAQYEGQDVTLCFAVYVMQKASVEVRYMDALGQEQTAMATCSKLKQWTTVSVTLENVAFGGGVDGYDLFVHTTASDGTVRLHAVYLQEATAMGNLQTGLIQTDFETDSYIVADVNVLSFGAKGDGMTDDTSAFLDAIAAVEQMGGGTVFVPAGYYCLTDTLRLPQGVGLVGELEQGTARGTVLCIYGDKGKTAPADGAVVMYAQSAVINMAFWYPEQTIVGGRAIPYPPTLVQDQSEGVTIRNVTLVNSYTGIHFAKNNNNSLQYVRDIYGTCLELGYINNLSLDIGRVENLTLSPDIWLASGLPGTPNATLLRTYMIRNSVGMQMQRIDWTYYENITIEGYRVGMLFNASEDGSTNGHMYNVRLLDCYDCIRAENINWLIASNCTLRAAGGNGAAAVRVESGCVGEMSFNGCTLTTSGANALLSYGKIEFALMDCVLTSNGKSTYVNLGGKNEMLINTTLSGNAGGTALLEVTGTPTLPTGIDHAATVVTKPASDAFIDLTEAPYNAKSGEDVTEALQSAIDALRESGGTVYVPAGTYYLSDYITVHAGIEVRGAVAWAQKQNKTSFLTDVGENDPDGEALFTLYDGAGLRGFGVVYQNQTSYDLHPYSYTVRGNGAGIYLVSMSLGNAWRMVDFATYRCDGHYIEYLQGVPLETGIYVGGGSEGGIVRDCQITPNTWKGYTPENTGSTEWSIVYDLIMEQCSPYKIGESKDQILYHNFVYGAWRGLEVLDGAKDVYILGHGVDGANVSAYFTGDCSVTMVNSQLVNLFHTGKDGILNYLITDEDFSGELTLINSSFWGPTNGAWVFNGDGDVKLYGVQMHSAGAPMCQLNGGTLELYGLLEMVRGTDFVIGEDALALTLSGNVFPGGLQIDSSANDFVLISGKDVEE